VQPDVRWWGFWRSPARTPDIDRAVHWLFPVGLVKSSQLLEYYPDALIIKYILSVLYYRTKALF